MSPMRLVLLLPFQLTLAVVQTAAEEDWPTAVQSRLVQRADALQVPRSKLDRRAVLAGALSTAAAPAVAKVDSSVYDDARGFGGGGALRSDIGESVQGSGVEILVSDLSYKELKACPPKFFLPAKGGPWDCIEITATALNQGKRKKATAAEVFGQVYDAENFACLAVSLDPTQKAPLAVLDEPFKQGEKKQVTFTLAVQARSPRPFRLAGFKASYRSANMEKVFKPFDDCEIDSSKCADGEDQPENAQALMQGSGYKYNTGK